MKIIRWIDRDFPRRHRSSSHKRSKIHARDKRIYLRYIKRKETRIVFKEIESEIALNESEFDT